MMDGMLMSASTLMLAGATVRAMFDAETENSVPREALKAFWSKEATSPARLKSAVTT